MICDTFTSQDLIINTLPYSQDNDFIFDFKFESEDIFSSKNTKQVNIFNNHNYLFVVKNTDWKKTQKDCESMFMHLVTITSQEEQNFVKGLASNYEVWIGIAYKANEGKWDL